jgi:MFS family permease
MAGILRVSRSRGMLSGLLLLLLGAWGALVPFVGPYFHYAYTPDKAWTYTTGRLWLEILPGAAVALGGLIVLASASRPVAHFGAWLAVLAGAWFGLGSVIGPTWTGMSMTAGTPVGGTVTRALEQIGFFTGLALVVVLLAAMALGRFSVVSVRDARRAAASEPEEDTAADDAPASGGWRRFIPARKSEADDEAVDADSERVTSGS